MVKVSKYSIKSEAVIRRCTTKNHFWTVLNIPQIKILFMGLKQGSCTGVLLKNFLLFTQSVSATKYYHWTCFLRFIENVTENQKQSHSSALEKWKMTFTIFIEKHLWCSPREKAVSPHVWNCTKKDVFSGVFLWID